MNQSLKICSAAFVFIFLSQGQPLRAEMKCPKWIAAFGICLTSIGCQQKFWEPPSNGSPIAAFERQPPKFLFGINSIAQKTSFQDAAPETLDARLNLLRRLPKLRPYNNNIEKKSQAVKVSMGQAVVGNALMYTHGLGPCVGLIFWNKTTHHAAIFHIHSLADETITIPALLKELGDGEIEVFLAGGYHDQKTTTEAKRLFSQPVYRVLVELDKLSIPVIAYRINPGSDGIGIDPLTGEIF
jgi:hypothetical protein